MMMMMFQNYFFISLQ